LPTTGRAEQASNTLPVKLAEHAAPVRTERPYLINRPAGGAGTLSIIEPKTSAWNKFSRYVLGL
jgi:hypothetical protein